MLISLLTWKLLFRTVKVFVFYSHVILCCCLNFSFILLNCCQRPCLTCIWLGNFIEISLMTEYMIHFYKCFTNSSTKSHRHLQYFPSQHHSNPIYCQTVWTTKNIFYISSSVSNSTASTSLQAATISLLVQQNGPLTPALVSFSFPIQFFTCQPCELISSYPSLTCQILSVKFLLSGQNQDLYTLQSLPRFLSSLL